MSLPYTVDYQSGEDVAWSPAGHQPHLRAPEAEDLPATTGTRGAASREESMPTGVITGTHTAR